MPIPPEQPAKCFTTEHKEKNKSSRNADRSYFLTGFSELNVRL